MNRSIVVKIRATFINTKIAEKYIELVNEKYTEPKEEAILGCYVTEIEASESVFPGQRSSSGEPPRKKKRNEPKQKQINIRDMLGVTETVKSSKFGDNVCIIEID